MKPSNLTLTTVLLAMLVTPLAGCGRDTGTLKPAPAVTDPVVFNDDFGSNVDFQAFMGSYLYAVTIDTQEKHDGVASLKIAVPPPGEYAGGAFTTNVLRDLSGYTALTFWAKASKVCTLNVAGLGNDNTGTSKYTAQWNNIPLTTEWKYFVIPIPLPAKLALEGGLFFFAEAAEGVEGHTIWFDQVIFANVASISNPRPLMKSQTLSTFIGGAVNVTGTQTTFDVGGTDVLIDHMPGYLTFASSNDTVATIDRGVIKPIDAGTAKITATLGQTPVQGELTLNVSPAPTVAAPAPGANPADVISLFSNSYSNITVESWSADWPDMADVTDFKVAGNDVKAYTNLIYAGILFETHLVDATEMTHFNIDVWVPEGVTFFRVKLVDFGEDGVYGGAPDGERELTFTAATTPAIVPGSWARLDIPLESFMGGPMGLFAKAHLAQLLISGGNITAFIDNVFFHKVTTEIQGK
jgi:hypothetical protein